MIIHISDLYHVCESQWQPVNYQEIYILHFILQTTRESLYVDELCSYLLRTAIYHVALCCAGGTSLSPASRRLCWLPTGLCTRMISELSSLLPKRSGLFTCTFGLSFVCLFIYIYIRVYMISVKTCKLHIKPF